MLFSPGPTEIEPEIREIAAMQLPYFRGSEYTGMILELMENVQTLFQTQNTPLILTASGTGVMEMAILNLLNPKDKVVVLNCGTFGRKWTEMCHAFDVDVQEMQVEWGKLPDLDQLNDFLTDDIKALLITAHETSTGLLNDIKAIGELTRQKDILLIVDAVSSIGADEFLMDSWGCDCAIVSSQKALACMPGISFIVFSERAWQVVPTVKRHRYYFDAIEYMKNAHRGMLPYTPAINVTYQVHERLNRIKKIGLANYNAMHLKKAEVFRKAILSNPEFSLFAERQSNALSSITLPEYCSMSQIIAFIKEHYGWYIAPNPTHDEHYLRVSHMGCLTENDLIRLAERIHEAAEFFKHKN